MNTITEFTASNQVRVPDEIVKTLGLEPGTRLEWIVGTVPGTVTLEVVPSIEKLLEHAKELAKNMDRSVLDELIEARSR